MAETVQLVAMERVDGMGNACASGSYVRFILIDNDAKRQTFKTSIGAAETLVHEIDGILGRSASKGNAEPVGYVSAHGLIELATGFVTSIVAKEVADKSYNHPLYDHPPSATTINDEQVEAAFAKALDQATSVAETNRLLALKHSLAPARIRPSEADNPPYLSREYYDQWSTE